MFVDVIFVKDGIGVFCATAACQISRLRFGRRQQNVHFNHRNAFGGRNGLWKRNHVLLVRAACSRQQTQNSGADKFVSENILRDCNRGAYRRGGDYAVYQEIYAKQLRSRILVFGLRSVCTQYRGVVFACLQSDFAGGGSARICYDGDDFGFIIADVHCAICDIVLHQILCR